MVMAYKLDLLQNEVYDFRNHWFRPKAREHCEQRGKFSLQRCASLPERSCVSYRLLVHIYLYSPSVRESYETPVTCKTRNLLKGFWFYPLGEDK